MNRSNVLISWIIRGETHSSSLSFSQRRVIRDECECEGTVFSLDEILIAVRRARLDIRWRSLSFRGNDIPLDRLDANCKVNYDIPVNPFDIRPCKGTSVLLSSTLFPPILSLCLSFCRSSRASFCRHRPRKIKLRMLVTGVRRRNAWTIRDRTQNSTRRSPVRWKSWQRVVIPPTAHPTLVVLVISKCDADENDAWQREKRNWKISSCFADVRWHSNIIPSFLLNSACNWPLLIHQVPYILLSALSNLWSVKRTLIYT